MLAGLSPDYYSRLEQGRQAVVSAEILGALARALRLTSVEHAHLRDLAVVSPRRRVSGPVVRQRPDPGLLRLMTSLDHLPVLLLGHRGEVLARNTLAVEVLGHPLEPGISLARYLFQDPVARERIVEWADYASAAVAALRRETARRPDDRRLALLVQELRAGDKDFALWWDDHAVRDYSSVTKTIDHPVAGRLIFGIEFVGPPLEPDQQLVVYTVEPGSPTAHILPMLSSWATAAQEIA